MFKFPIGVVLESFRLTNYYAVKRRQSLDLTAFRCTLQTAKCTRKSFRAKARELLKYLKDTGLVVMKILEGSTNL